MKITIQQSILSHHLDRVSKALSSNTTLPILSQIFFNADENGLIIIAGNADMSIKSVIPTDKFDLIVPGTITIPGKKIVEIVKKVDDDITIEHNGQQTTIRSGKSKFELIGLDPEEYPKFQDIGGESFSLSGQVLKGLIEKTIFATSKKENTPILTGILFNISANGLQLTGCDRHRLAQIKKRQDDGIERMAVVSRLVLLEFIKIIDEKDQMELSFEGAHFIVKTEEYTFVARILEGTYPDTTKLIPNQFNAEVTVSTIKLIQSLDRVKIISAEDKTNIVKMTVSDEVEFTSTSTSGGKVIESLEYSKRTGEGFTISFNVEYVLEALKAISDDETIIHFVMPMTPFILTGTNDEDKLFLILPYRTTA